MTDEARSNIRNALYAAVRRYPGIHVRGLERYVGVSAPLVLYHLKRLLAEGFVESHDQRGYARYFPTAKKKASRVTKRDLALVGVLREEVPLHVVLLLLDAGPLAHADLVDRLGIAKSTLSYHLAKLAEVGIVEREPGSARVRLADRDRIYALLLAYDPTPDLLDAFHDLWDDLYG